MRAYVYQAALLCEDCGVQTHEGVWNSAGSYEQAAWADDSDFLPQGPYPDGGGEADYPQHCDHCGLFLENPLTSDGWEYVRERLQQSPTAPGSRQWAEFYGFDPVAFI